MSAEPRPSGVVTRFAPTPSGYLHLGNAVNLQLTSWLAATAPATLALRIDDADATRLRPAYVQDIFEVLAWMDVPWQVGPKDVEDYARQGTQSDRAASYREELERARSRGLELYACTCSRSTQVGPATGGCTGGCRDQALTWEAHHASIRVHVPAAAAVAIGDRTVRLAEEVGDVVLWRRDDLPAYHLVSVIEDRDLGTTHIVRGRDLEVSTALQLWLAPYLDASSLQSARILHHDLVLGPDGAKLSKSQVRTGQPMPRTAAQRALITQHAAALAPGLGITPP